MSFAYARRMLFYTAAGESVGLDGLWQNQAALIVCPGPSLTGQVAELQTSRITTLAVNNAWTVVRPRLWCCIDAADRFAADGWRDPGIMKFAPMSQMQTRLREPDGTGNFRTLGLTPGRCPSTLFFRSRAGFSAATFLEDAAVQIGPRAGERDLDAGASSARSVLLAAIKLLVHLGFTRLYLVGCDFSMNTSTPYAFGCKASRGYARHNNATYQALSARLQALRSVLERHGVQLVNCTEGGALSTLPREDLTAMLRREEPRSALGADVADLYRRTD